jgi:tellurite resistance protein
MPIADLLPAAPISDVTHADALLELAYLMTVADGHITDEERRAFGEIFARVRGRASQAGEIDALVQRFTANAAAGSIADRVRAVGPTLPMELREAAFKVAIGLALADRDASPAEDALMNVFFDCLELDPARAEALAREGREA